jgi:hypothetical protein
LWLLAELPSGDPVHAAPPSEGLVEADKYGGTFLRVRATTVNLADGLEHPFTFALAHTAGPGGETFRNLQELRSMAGAVWYDVGGTLGKAYAVTGAELSPAALADRIQSGELVYGRSGTGADGHPELHLTAGPATGRRRATLGDLVTVLGEPVRVVQLREASANEIDVIGVVIQPPPDTGPLPGDPWSSGVTVAELARAMAVGLPASGSGPVVDRLELAIRTAEEAIGWRLGRRTVADWPDGIPAGARSAVVQVATRVYRASDVTFGVLQTELGSSYVGRWVTPEVELGLLGLRRRWGIA